MMTLTVKKTLGGSPCGHMARVICDWPDSPVTTGDVVRLDGHTYRVIELVQVLDEEQCCLGLTVVRA
jgi:hypothetical protein